jgi:hypothetical protein
LPYISQFGVASAEDTFIASDGSEVKVETLMRELREIKEIKRQRSSLKKKFVAFLLASMIKSGPVPLRKLNKMKESVNGFILAQNVKRTDPIKCSQYILVRNAYVKRLKLPDFEYYYIVTKKGQEYVNSILDIADLASFEQTKSESTKREAESVYSGVQLERISEEALRNQAQSDIAEEGL